MAKRVTVNLFGQNGQRSLEIQPRGGFPTRHITVPVEPVPSIFSPVTPEMVAADRKAAEQSDTAARENQAAGNDSAPARLPNPDFSEKRETPVTEAAQQAAALLQPPVSSQNTDQKRPVTPEAALDVLQKMTHAADPNAVDCDWFIIDEILFVATTQCNIRANHTTLLAALRELHRHGHVAHKTNRFDQHLFKWVGDAQKTDLPTLLAAVDAILGGTPDA